MPSGLSSADSRVLKRHGGDGVVSGGSVTYEETVWSSGEAAVGTEGGLDREGSCRVARVLYKVGIVETGRFGGGMPRVQPRLLRGGVLTMTEKAKRGDIVGGARSEIVGQQLKRDADQRAGAHVPSAYTIGPLAS